MAITNFASLLLIADRLPRRSVSGFGAQGEQFLASSTGQWSFVQTRRAVKKHEKKWFTAA
jgi:hypothetical protein